MPEINEPLLVASMPPTLPAQVDAYALDQHPVLMYLARLSPGSRRTMREALGTIAGILSNGAEDALSLNWSSLRYAQTIIVRTVLVERYAVSTANKHLAALRGVLREAWRLQQISAEDYHRAIDLPPVRGTTLLRGRALAATELQALFSACASDTSPAGVRDEAMLAILYGAGLRRSEVVALDVEDVDVATRAVTVRAGKGSKARTTYMPVTGIASVESWLRLRGAAPGALFWPVIKSGRLVSRRMTDQAVLYILQRRARQAGMSTFTPHDLRRSMISDLLDAGADIATVQRLAGHANVQTTQRYDRRPEATKRRAADALTVPAQRQRGEADG